MIRSLAQRFVLLLAAASVTFMLLPAQPGAAMCAHPNFPRLSSELYSVRTAPLVALGRIVGSAGIPLDAHGKYSFYLDVTKFYSGKGPARIEVTNYAHYQDLPAGFEIAGNQTSKNNSKDFLLQWGGQTAILFLQHDRAAGKDAAKQYASEYAFSDCTYSTIGDSDSFPMEHLLNNVFSNPVPSREPTQQVLPSPSPVPSVSAPEALPPPTPRISDSKRDLATRAAALAVIVAATLILFAHPKSPLFQRWRA